MAHRFELLMTDATGARLGLLHTRHGTVPTPVFMPVATHAAFRHVSTDEAEASGSRVLLANTYHLMLKPGREVFERMGGIHAFMKWDGPVLTDSGGYQIFSLPEDRVITEKGAHFRSFYDNSRQLLSPESSIAMQKAIDSDIMMVLDVCIPSTSSAAETQDAMERTHRWALRSLATHQANTQDQALFGIVQGGVHAGLRSESAAFLTAHPFDGFAIGGLAVGESKGEREEMTALATALLPQDKPRYLMGVGTPIDLIEAVQRGVDMFDCIIPTKMAQQGYAYTFEGLIRVTRAAFRVSQEPLDRACDCGVCKKYSRGYLHHLMTGKHQLGARFLSIHNLRHYQLLTQAMRSAIEAGGFRAWAEEMRERLRPPRQARKALG
ncbi:MAG: tRNA guanosine(34) transglycosylase Tgt [Myxococcaceae bacterium]